MIRTIFWIIIATIFASCESVDSSSTSIDGYSGTGGSLARFTISGNMLYTVNNTSVKGYDLTNPEKPFYKDEVYLGWGAETIFALDSLIFIGAEWGMEVLSKKQEGHLQRISSFSHARSCDPVVSDGNYAYITLNSRETMCSRGLDELDIVDIRNIFSPKLVTTIPLNGPRGLAIHNDTLFVCDNGLKILNTADKLNIKTISYFSDINAKDVIVIGNHVMVINDDGFTQYEIGNGTFEKLSEIKIMN